MKMKSTCLFCGEELEYDNESFFFSIPPKRKFCNDRYWDTEHNSCLKAKEGLPSQYKSYIWLCGIYRQKDRIQPYKGDWQKHYQTLSAQYQTDCREYWIFM